MQTKTITVPNISCGHCVKTIESEVGELGGIVSVKAEESTKKVTVRWDEPQKWERIAALLDEIGYPAAEA
jgi:copper ion binding protein